jgi:hypothetical protein
MFQPEEVVCDKVHIHHQLIKLANTLYPWSIGNNLAMGRG